MLKYRLLIFMLLVWPGDTFAQTTAPNDPRLKIDYWLQNYRLDSNSKKATAAQEVFKRLIRVADKPVGVMPRLYVFKNLELGKVFALPDRSSIILAASVVDFCFQDATEAEPRLAFVLGHELSHIVNRDYWMIEQILTFASDLHTAQASDQAKRIASQLQWQQSQKARQAIETQADEYGILYASLAGYDVNAIISPGNSFISEYYRKAGLDLYGDLSNKSAKDRVRSLNRRLAEIVTHLDLFEYGMRMFAIGRYDAAIALFEKFLTQYPSREVFNNLGLCYYQKALALYAKLKSDRADRDPNLRYRVSTQIDALVQLQPVRSGASQQQFRDFINEAVRNFEQARSHDPGYSTALNNLGCVYLLSGELDFAKGYFKKAMERNFNPAISYNNLGVAFLVEAERELSSRRKVALADQARSSFQAAAELRPDSVVPLYNLAIFSHQQNDTAAAQKKYTAYLKIDSGSIYADEIRQLQQGKPIKKRSQRYKKEYIAGLDPHADPRFANARHNEFVTPDAKMTILRDPVEHVQSFRFVSRQERENVSMLVALVKYAGKTATGIGIGSPQHRIEAQYRASYQEIETTKAIYRVYSEPAIAFEIRDGRVQSWFLYEVY